MPQERKKEMQNARHRARVKGVTFLGAPDIHGHCLSKIHTPRTAVPDSLCHMSPACYKQKDRVGLTVCLPVQQVLARSSVCSDNNLTQN